MRDTTSEQKLALVQQIRSSYNRNQYDLTNRERLLYGKTSPRNDSYLSYKHWNSTKAFGEEIPEAEMENLYAGTGELGISFFRLRFLIAAVLLMAVIFLDMSGGSFAGLTTGEIFDAISQNYADEIDSWVSAQLSTQEKD